MSVLPLRQSITLLWVYPSIDVSIAFLYVLTSKSLINSPTGLLILSIHLFILVPYVLLYFASHHSKFSTLLSVLFSFIWLTYGRLSGFGINASATSLWTLIALGLSKPDTRIT